MKCSVENCGKVAWARSFCDAHYYRWRRYGEPTGGGPNYAPPGAPAKFLDHAVTATSDECLVWPFARDSNGYGRISVNRKSALAHRVVCEKVYGPAPEDKPEAAHLCGNGSGGCVNGRHLAWKDRQENAADKVIHGSIRRGEDVHASRLKEDDVRFIWEKRDLSNAVLAKKFCVTSSSIQSIRNGQNWRWLTSKLGGHDAV